MEKILQTKMQKTSSEKTKIMTRVAVLTAVGAVLYRIEIPFMVGHLKLDPSVVPSLIGGLLLGPIYGVIIELLKNITHLFVTSSAGVGELINFLVGSSLILPVSFFYKKDKTVKNYLIGSVFGMISILLIGALCNYLFTPLFYYALGLGTPTQAEIMGFVQISFGLNSFKGFITLALTFWVLPAIKKNNI